MANYSQKKLDTYNKLADKGKLVTFNRAIDGVNDPINRTYIEGTILDINGSALFVDFSSKEKDKLNIQKVNKKLMFASVDDKTVSIGDTIIDPVNGKLRVKNTEPFAPDGGVVIFSYIFLES